MLEYFNPQGVSLNYANSLQSDGQLIFQKNTWSNYYGVVSKRPGYGTYLNNPDNAQVQSLFLMPNIQNSGSINVMRASGSQIWYSTQGTANFAAAGNGTIQNGAYFGNCVQGTTLIGGDGFGSTRWTVDGQNFTNATLAPIANFFAQYQGRAYAAGTSNILSYSVADDITNWNTSGTSDSSSFTVPGEGSLLMPFVCADKLTITKSRGKMLTWDGQNLIDLATNFGPYSPWCIGNIEDYRLYANQYGVFGFDGQSPQLLSNPVQRAFYNAANSGIPSANFPTMQAEVWYYMYLAQIGTFTDDFTQRTINNAILTYDYQKNAFHFWQFANTPTSFLGFNDNNNARQLIFGAATGQCYKMDRSLTSDNGRAIDSEAIFLFTYASQSSSFSPNSAQTVFGSSYEKKFNWLRIFYNKGTECNLQFCFTDSLDPQHWKWSEQILMKETGSTVGDYFQMSSGVAELRFPRDENNMPRSRFLLVRIYDSSDSSTWSINGFQVDAEVQDIR